MKDATPVFSHNVLQRRNSSKQKFIEILLRISVPTVNNFRLMMRREIISVYYERNNIS
jgi:hypothetical protein